MGRVALVPTFRVRVNGQDLPDSAAYDVLRVTVGEDVSSLNMCTILLKDWDQAQLTVRWMDADIFTEGNEIEILMGYVDQLESIFSGEITGLEPEFVSHSVPRLVVRGYDRRHRLMRGRKTRSFSQITDSDIVTQIGQDAGLRTDVEDSKVTLAHVMQCNQTDLEFLQGRAQHIGYEIGFNEDTLHFRSNPHNLSPVVTLAPDVDLLEFFPRLTTMAQTSEVTVRGWDAKQKTAIVATATVGDESGLMMGDTSGPQAVSGTFGASALIGVQQSLQSQADADAKARGRFQTMALDYITGDGICIGRTDLRAGTVIAIEGVGNRFGGNYYVTTTTHRYTPQQGYRTQFTFRRNAT
ncbi:MAG: contractile injection system protein, VgrG/Pvc8 family [Anaerolineae bacterium]|nr:contractile injection system protein, VgrG/Pvc8 family [Anaerolineae bacterium]